MNGIRTHKSRGLTLLEVLVVIAILSGSFAASLTFAERALMGNARAQRLAKATVLAQNELEYWRAQPPAARASLSEGQQAFANPLTTSPANAATTSVLSVRRIEAGIVELTARVELPVRPNSDAVASLTAWIPVEAAQ
jgi:prepilin-type N-terminal cleavage/methylation domain-containing protein